MADKIDVLFTEEEVEKRIREMGDRISRDYEGKEVTLICILKGATFFACELAKRITVPVQIEFMRCSSYGNETESSGVVKIIQDLDAPIRDRNIIVVEDIIDTGRTMHYLMEVLRQRGPESLALCALLDKPDRRVVEDVALNYTGFVIPDRFVVGWGLDYAQKYRNLPYIGIVTPDTEAADESEAEPDGTEAGEENGQEPDGVETGEGNGQEPDEGAESGQESGQETHEYES